MTFHLQKGTRVDFMRLVQYVQFNIGAIFISAALCDSVSLSQETLGDDAPHADLATKQEPSKEIEIDFDQVYGDQGEPMHRADIYRPTGRSEGARLPCVLLIHGGGWSLGDKRNDSLHARRLAGYGFVVVAVNYRLAPQHVFPAQLDDCWTALDWITKNDEKLGVDSDRLGTWGYSAGGHLSALIATQPRDGFPRVKASVVGGAPCDLTYIPKDTKVLSPVFGGTRSEYPDRYRDASPVTHVSSDDPPIFLYHGSKDWLVPTHASRAMEAALLEHDVPHEFLLVENKAHIMTFLDMDAAAQSFKFLKTHLQ
jgi:acetyl esterase/lipase